MAERSNIEWTDATFNPWQGCTKVSPGCDHCYAEARQDTRLHVVKWGAGEPRKRTTAAYWREPIKWNARGYVRCTTCGWRGEHADCVMFGDQCPRCDALVQNTRRRVFCASLADVFDNEVDPQWRVDLFELIGRTPNLDWLLLTKRIGNAANMIHVALARLQLGGYDLHSWPWPNVWIGATIVNQEEADRDTPKLLATPARVRFLSMEPLLGPVDLPGFNGSTSWCPVCRAIVPESLLPGHEMEVHKRRLGAQYDPEQDCAAVYNLIDWVIVGGESGSKARAFDLTWAQSLVDQCKAAGVPVLVKQLGDNPCRTDGSVIEVHDYGSKGKAIERWPESLRAREFPK